MAARRPTKRHTNGHQNTEEYHSHTKELQGLIGATNKDHLGPTSWRLRQIMCQVLVTSKKSAKVLCHHFNGILLCSSMFYSFLSFGMVKPNVMSDIHLFQFSGGDAKENRVGDNGLVQNLHQSTRQFGGRRENQGIKASLAWAKQLPQCHD